MSNTIIYHNPRCKKSREGLALLKEHGIEPDIINYIKEPLSLETIIEIAKKLGYENTPRAMMRTKEALYKELDLKNETLPANALFDAMVKHPKLIERPIIITDKGACIARPTEKLIKIL